MPPDNKEKFILISGNFSSFSIQYILLHLLESPNRGDSKGMHQCIFQRNGKENISNTREVRLFYLLYVNLF